MADIGHAAKCAALWQGHIHSIYSGFRQELTCLQRLDVGCREAYGASELPSVHNAAAIVPAMTEYVGGIFNPAFCEGLADGAAVDFIFRR